MKNIRLQIIFIIFTVCLLSISLFAKRTQIKFATIAPEGSVWMNIMEDINTEIQTATKTKIKFKFYPGGILGDERSILTKMEAPIPRVNSAVFSGSGLNSILKESRAFDIPFTFNNYDEIDYMRDVTFDTYYNLFQQEGFILLGWVDVGNVYIFLKNKINIIDELGNQKVWVWDNDPIAITTFKEFGVKPTSLNVTEVLTSLQTGLINTIYGPPLGVLSLQWHRKVNYYIDTPMTFSTSAFLILEKTYNKLSKEYQTILKKTIKKNLDKLNDILRKEESKSIDILHKNEVNPIKLINDKTSKIIDSKRKIILNNLDKEYFPEGFVYKFLQVLDDYRKSQKQ